MQYEVNRENFNKIVKSYREYVELYRLINGGSLEGATPFTDFYWRYSFFVKYQDVTIISSDSN